MKGLALVLLMSCTKPTTGTVTIAQWPGKIEITHEHPACYIPEKPVPPAKPEWPSADEDYYRRIYVHRRDYDLLYDYIIDDNHYDEYILTCLKTLMEVEQ